MQFATQEAGRDRHMQTVRADDAKRRDPIKEWIDRPSMVAFAAEVAIAIWDLDAPGAFGICAEEGAGAFAGALVLPSEKECHVMAERRLRHRFLAFEAIAAEERGVLEIIRVFERGWKHDDLIEVPRLPLRMACAWFQREHHPPPPP